MREIEARTELAPIAVVVEAGAIPWLFARFPIGVDPGARPRIDVTASDVHAASGLDLDYLGAHVAKELGAGRASPHLRRVQDAESFERHRCHR